MIQFNKKLIKELKELIPPKVSELDLKWESEEDGVVSEEIYGWIRFDGNRLDAIYLESLLGIKVVKIQIEQRL